MLERIWSGWRAAYVGGERPTSGSNEASPFTQILESGEPDEATHIVHRGERVFAIMNIHPYTTGHLLVLPYREVADLADLTADETTELWSTVTDGVAAPEARCPPIFTCTSCRAGPATATSCRRSRTPRPFPNPCPRARTDSAPPGPRSRELFRHGAPEQFTRTRIAAGDWPPAVVACRR